MQKLLGYIKEYAVIALLAVVFIVPFTADAVQAINMKVEDTTISTALVTGKLLEPFSLSVQIGYRESGIDGTQFIFTQPFALGPNNTISKQLTNLKTDTDYCMFVSDAGNSAQTPIYGSELCFKTKKENDVADKEVSVLLDTQNAGFKEATINLKVTITGTGSFSLGTRYSSAGPGTYDQTLGEFFNSTQPGTFTPKIEFKNLTGNTDYYYQVYNTATNTNYFDGFFRTSAKEGQTLNSGNGVSAATPPGCIPGQYCLLAPLPGLSTIDTTDTRVADYLKIIFRIGIALAGVLAVLMLVIGGIEYMSSDVITSKESAKGRMTNAILGLILVLGAYAILNTLNPKLLEVNLDLQEQKIDVENADTDTPVGNIGQFSADISALGITCPGSGGTAAIANIAQSFNNKVTYGYGSKGEVGPAGTVKLDCSGYVNRVLQCANVPFINSGTSGIFAGGEEVKTLTDTSVNDIPLKAGDLLGWKQGENERYGHVFIYIGNGKMMDSHGPSGAVGKAIGTFAPNAYKDRITFIKRAP
jgi:cell wall-associated NlpC family hydrolase